MSKIEIGSVTEEFLGEDSDGETMPPNECCAYVAVDVTIDDKTVSVGTMIGAHESDHGSIKAAGCGVRPYLTTWYANSCDHQMIAPELKEAVKDALYAARARLWRETESLRG